MWVEVDGRRVFAHDGGVPREEGRLVLLVHGAANDHSVWRYQTRRLASRGHRVLAVDLPGHGKSDAPALESIPEMAEFVLATADALDAGDVAVIGHSMGSLVALEAASQRSIAGIALIAAAVPMQVHGDLRRAADDRDVLARDLIIGWSFTGGSRFGAHDDPGVWKSGANRRLLERGADVLGIDLAACASWEPVDLGAISAPALVVVGAVDRMTPAASGRAVAAALGSSTLVEIDDGSHVALYQRPDEINRALDDWLASL